MTPAEKIVMRRLRREIRKVTPGALGAAKSFIRPAELRAATNRTASELSMPTSEVLDMIGSVMAQQNAEGPDDLLIILKHLD